MVKLIQGDLLASEAQVIAHQCNCISKGGAAGIAAIIFKKFPYSDTYSNRITNSTPGTISLHGNKKRNERFIVNMYSQFFPGGLNEEHIDNESARKIYFQKCLNEIKEIEGLKSIAFPYLIGCGIAGGNWKNYYKMIEQFSNTLPNVEVNIVYLEQFKEEALTKHL